MNHPIISNSELEYIITRKLDYTLNKRHNPPQDKYDESFTRLFTSGIYYISIVFEQWTLKKVMIGLNSKAGLIRFTELEIISSYNECILQQKNYEAIDGNVGDVFNSYEYSLGYHGEVVSYKDSSGNYWDNEMGMHMHFPRPKDVILEVLQTKTFYSPSLPHWF